MEPSSLITLAWYDYIVFFVILSFSVIIGIYYGCFGSKQSTKTEYLTGGNKMKPFPIALSLLACNNSSEILLAFTTETYSYGAYLLLQVICFILLYFVTIHIYFPVFYKLQISTAYEYLERRFDRRSRQFASVMFIINITFYLCLTIYTCALTFAAASGWNIHIVAFTISSVCIFYTSIGGLKTVVWTDTYQFLINLGSLFFVLIIGIKSVGGFSEIWQKSFESGRFDFLDFDPDLTKRNTFWIMIIGFTVFLISVTSVDQVVMQKVLSVPTFQDATRLFLYYIIGNIFILLVSILLGLVMYAKYAECDPFGSKKIERLDQILPYFILEMSQNIPGLSGTFCAGMLGSSLSVQSSLLNCLSGTVYNDFIRVIIKKDLSERKSTNILKITVVVIGIICTLLIFVVENLGGIFSWFISVGGSFAGPFLGLFTLGLLFPRANSAGAFYGTISGFICTLGIAIPAKYYEFQGHITYPTKLLSVNGCTFINDTGTNITELLTNETVNVLFRISFYYYPLIGVVVTITMGLIISYATSKNTVVEKDLISPWCHSLLPKTERCLQSRNKEERLMMAFDKK